MHICRAVSRQPVRAVSSRFRRRSRGIAVRPLCMVRIRVPDLTIWRSFWNGRPRGPPGHGGPCGRLIRSWRTGRRSRRSAGPLAPLLRCERRRGRADARLPQSLCGLRARPGPRFDLRSVAGAPLGLSLARQASMQASQLADLSAAAGPRRAAGETPRSVGKSAGKGAPGRLSGEEALSPLRDRHSLSRPVGRAEVRGGFPCSAGSAGFRHGKPKQAISSRDRRGSRGKCKIPLQKATSESFSGPLFYRGKMAFSCGKRDFSAMYGMDSSARSYYMEQSCQAEASGLLRLHAWVTNRKI